MSRKIFELVFTATPEEVLRWNEGRFFAAVTSRMGMLMDRLRAKINANLHGDVLQARSGRLAGSLSAVTVSREGDTIIGELSAGEGVPYAAVHEFGGQGVYQIVAVNKQALKMMLGSKEEIFRKAVTHKAALKRSYFLSAIDSMEEEFLEGLREACIEGISGE